MQADLGAGLVGQLTRRLPARRWQTAYWLGKVLVPRRPFVGRIHGGLFEVHPGEVASTSAFFTGFYEREVTMWCLELIRSRPPALVVDVGANFGYYPLLFGLLTGGKTESIAFEPDPSNFEWLGRNIKLNPGLKVTAVREAVGDADGSAVPFEAARDGHNLWARVGGVGTNERVSATIDVPTTTLDGYLDRQGIAEVPLTLIDVEGYESRVIRGMSRGIAERRYTTVMIEFHPWAFPDPEAEIQEIANHFRENGYTGYRFQHLQKPHPDKSGDYYRLAWSDSLLGPLTSDHLSFWEHYLFEVDGGAAV
jgi:FkbM family methyltransferase